MSPRAYYNEIDPYAAQWIRNLIAAGHIAPGDVDTRSIVDVRAADLAGYTQCHFFAGIGVWSYALRQAGWRDDEPVWTGSCPCQPYSDAGEGEAFDDERDLWPDFFRLIVEAQCQRRAIPIFGEQVASKGGLSWLDALHADLESQAFTVGAADTCAAGFGCPGIRQRFYFVADPASEQRGSGRKRAAGVKSGAIGGPARLRAAGESVGHTLFEGLEGHRGHGDDGHQPGRIGAHKAGPVGAPGPVNGFWGGADWLPCIDGKARPVEPGTFPLVTGALARVGRLRAYGNAINAQQAAEFIRAYIEVRTAT